jgi:putative methionine-R-sulfoxide reductase with GAF domain
LHDVILDDRLDDDSEVLVPITREETFVAAADVDAIRRQELSDVDGFNSKDEDDDTLY